MKIDVSKIVGWKIASKTKDITAKPLINLIVDKKVTNKFLLDTLEGKANINPNSQICIGGAGDAWQQSAENLLKKYDVIAIDTLPFTIPSIVNDSFVMNSPVFS